MLKSFAPESLTQAEGQTRRMSAETRQMIEAEQSFQKFVSPLPAMPAAPAAEGGAKAASRPAPTYDSESRTQMDRLIRGKQ
jgi:membrane protein required for colicin V production